MLGQGETDLALGHDAVRTRLAGFQKRWGVDGYRLVRVLPQPESRAVGVRPDESILVLDLTYLHAPLFPGIQQVLKRVVLPSGNDGYTDAARQAGLVVIRRDMAMPIHKK